MVLTYRTTYGLDLDTFYDLDLSYDIMDMTMLIFTISTYRTLFGYDFDNFYDIELSYDIWTSF